MSRKLFKRTYVTDGYYHVLNRGNAKMRIFHSQADYSFFLSVIAELVSKPKSEKKQKYTVRNYYKQISIIAFCLMPNHFHICVQQHEERVISEFIRSLSIRYTRYRNKNRNTVGHTFQDKFKARWIEKDSDLLNVIHYIHNNPKNICKNPLLYPYSSAQFYINSKLCPTWLNKESIDDIMIRGFGTKKSNLDSAYLFYFKN